MNSIGWDVAHLAWHEQICWLTRAQSLTPENFRKLMERVRALSLTAGRPLHPPLD